MSEVVYVDRIDDVTFVAFELKFVDILSRLLL